LHSHEYTQAAGRAGRRGRDLVGHVVHCNNLFPIPSLIDYKIMLGGKSQSLISKFRFSYPLVLNLVNNGKYCMEDFIRFAKKSMIYDELEVSIKIQKSDILQLEEIIDRKTGLIDKAIRTPKEVCVRFLELTGQFDNSRNKQRKAIERELESIKTLNRYVSQDSEIVSSCQELMNDLNNENRRLLYLETFVDKSIERVCDVLTSRKFLEKTEDTICEGSPEISIEYKMTKKGIMASGLAEIHPLVGSDCVELWNFFADFSPKQIATILSVFSDVKIQEDLRSQSPDTSDKFIDVRINEVCGLFDKYEYIETERTMTTGIDYHNSVNFDMPVYVSEWWGCEDELACKVFIQTRLPEKGVSVGDFTKAVLKISSIVRELSMTCEKCGMLDLLQKLSFIDAKILKYIVSSQSLYV
jgi:superfamily II RNA helicase